MLVRILGSSAGGGLPQWNCGCVHCSRARGSSPSLSPRTQSSVAVSLDGRAWLLLNASPDVRTQLAAHTDLGPRDGRVRDSAIGAVVITSADLDHVTGLLVLREGGAPAVYATRAVQVALREGISILPTLGAYGPVVVRDLIADQPTEPADREGRSLGLRVRAIALEGSAPLYMRAMGRESFGDDAHVIALEVTAPGRGTLVYAPGVKAWEPALAEAAERADLLLVDGTCMRDDELASHGIAGRASRAMGHLPLEGDDGLLARLKGVTRPRKVLVHVNNTNPVLCVYESDAVDEVLTAAGVELGEDGMSFVL